MVRTDSLATVPQLDLQRYLGTWFEICRLPLKWEDRDAQDITATYSLTDSGSVKVDNRCLNGKGEPTQAIGDAVPSDESNSKLRVSFLPDFLQWLPFTKGDYWVIRIADDYGISLVGTPDRKHLWLLARNTPIADSLRDDFLGTAAEQGFDLSALITPRQSGKVVDTGSDRR